MNRSLSNKIVKAIISIVLVCSLFAPTNIAADESQNEIFDSFSEETKEWIRNFESLPYDSQMMVSYRPSELLNSSYELKINYGLYTNSTNSIAPDNPGGGSGLPVGGYELPYNPSYWNGTRKDKANCYFYVMNEVGTSSDIETQQPGYLSGNTFNLSIYSTIIEAVEEDVLYLDNVIGFRSSSAGEKPGVDEYKVALVIAPGWDYHWYRQNPDKTWSHKQGHTSVTNVDASGNVIYSPKECDRDYSDINGTLYNYSIFVGYYIVEY